MSYFLFFFHSFQKSSLEATISIPGEVAGNAAAFPEQALQYELFCQQSDCGSVQFVDRLACVLDAFPPTGLLLQAHAAATVS